jgi:hypothetical protein
VSYQIAFAGALAALVAAAGPALAQFKTPEATVEQLYALYRASDSTGFNDKHAARFLEPAVARQFRSAKHIDADFFVQGQDFEIKDLTIEKPNVTGDKATIVVTFKNFNKPNRLTYTLVKAPNGWRIADVSNGKSTFRATLRASQ